MKWFFHSLIAANVLLAMSTASHAQTIPMHSASPCERHEKMHGHTGQRHAQHLSVLKSKLKLTANQEPAWLAFDQSMQTARPNKARPNHARLEKLNTPERLDYLQNQRTQMNSRMDIQAEATRVFYGSLDADQKLVFDAETFRTLHGTHERGHHQGH